MDDGDREVATGAKRGLRRLGVGLFGFALVGILLACSPSRVGSDPFPADPAPSYDTGGEGEEPLPANPAPPDGDGDPVDENPDSAPEPPVAADPPAPEQQVPQPSPTPQAPQSPGPADPPNSLEQFQRNCEEGVEEWRAGQVDFPVELAVDLNETISYNAAVDVREEALPPEEVIDTDSGSASQEGVSVKCTVAARLTAVGDALAIGEQANETVGGWMLQDFTPSGLLEWSWTVSAVQPVDQDLLLELRPAIVSDAETGDLAYAAKNQAGFTTHVHVEATVFQNAGYWFETNWPPLVAISLALGTGVVSVIGWVAKVKKEAAALKGG